MPSPDLEREPNGGYGAAWGLNPYELRPGGTDPTNIDDTEARDWLATLALKTSTTRDGVLIVTYSQNRCADWQGPFDDGSYFCTATLPPEPGTHRGWRPRRR